MHYAKDPCEVNWTEKFALYVFCAMINQPLSLNYSYSRGHVATEA